MTSIIIIKELILWNLWKCLFEDTLEAAIFEATMSSFLITNELTHVNDKAPKTLIPNMPKSWYQSRTEQKKILTMKNSNGNALQIFFYYSVYN